MPIHKVRVALAWVGLPTREIGFTDPVVAERFAKDQLCPNPGQWIALDTHFDGIRELVDEIRLYDIRTREIIATATIKPISP